MSNFEKEPRLSTVKYLEESLSLSLREVLAHMQERIVNDTTYFGIRAMKSPLDFWVYQEIISETRPDIVIEIGNFLGGTTLALAHVCDCLGHGRVIGVDTFHRDVPARVREHPRITLIEGDACSSFSDVARLCGSEEVLIIEDSSHTYENTLNILRTYSGLVRPGGYFIIEDGICHHGLDVGPSPGPYEAVATFVAENPKFVVDRSRESFLITWNPNGYLKRIR